ncbi:phosphoribosylformylglycinamidine synthase [Alloscardovia theropitheci]|uniref:Phosphoribosylformylglycinamidine synthase n=1 Tax=Alloscardovia theropitheci TaxID=2496842 RepID=A0A4R0R1D6_9BIFI|nr:phosphoribosylformylglycinamidine synthase [Alloscardovia theropitheci]TCD54956.1 phosphoribosylformylglycinamidine synthase [Alloscardovia theropitheci]
MVYRVLVEKKPGFDIHEQQLLNELKHTVAVTNLSGLRIFNRYDVEGLSEDLFEQSISTVFSEPQSDNVYNELPDDAAHNAYAVFAVEFLPGQFDQRAASASECIQLITQGERPTVRSSTVYALYGSQLTNTDVDAVRSYVINPVEAREASLELPETLTVDIPQPDPVEIIEGFREFTSAQLADFISDRGLAMDLADIEFCQNYFINEEKRDPSITEIRVIDTYWSDHCRHTTFNTELDSIEIDDAVVKAAFDRYLQMRHELGRDSKPISLMDMGTIGGRYLKSQGILKNLDESEEINACTVKVTVDVDGENQDWLFLFKNETHNHPTEIEPFGGAATCVGGAIRDPLSGRSYVYQAMRVTGAGDPRVPVSQTLQGKLPQRKIVTTAAAGYSSYGNQIGLATGQVHELYHPGYVAKRMEIGAVVGAAPQENVRREVPAPGDVIVLLGGRTGRDGIGGATGSSKSHNVESIEKDGAEVQKGNAPVERKLQRLFRRNDACKLIKRCNDFGAGGVSVAIGELADGVHVNLNAVPKKYEGLDGTELAISESQERMAVVLDAKDVDEFLGYAVEENLEAVPVADVTEDARVVMEFNGDTIVNVSREFLSSNGAAKHQDVHVVAAQAIESPWALNTSGDMTLAQRLTHVVRDINVASNKGLSERFDSTIGASTVLMPFGGKNQLTPSSAMVAKFPVDGETTTASAMAWGFNPFIMEKNQFTGAYLSVVESIAKLIAAGFTREKAYLSFQEYFEKLRDCPNRWGKPTAAVLGALMAQIDLDVAAIGGKDSMSGSFEDLDVPPTLVSFAVSTGHVDYAISPEFKNAGSRVIRILPHYNSDSITPQCESLKAVLQAVENLAHNHSALAISTPGYSATIGSLFAMSIGNSLGIELSDDIQIDDLFDYAYGSFIIELSEGATLPENELYTIEELGTTSSQFVLRTAHETVNLAEIQEEWESAMESVFPYRSEKNTAQTVETISYSGTPVLNHAKTSLAKPRVIIPVFPGNNCEYDTLRAFRRAGAQPETLIINNLTPQAVAESTHELAQSIRNSQIVMIPGGFSGGDEPDGSAKFIAAFFRSPEVTDAVRDLLNNRDGLMLGICNGFQALIKLGLVPFGDIVPMDDTCPTLTFNTIGRHQSRLVRTRVSSTKSPWLSKTEVGDIHTIAISHGEGRFVASPEMLETLKLNGQIATQYVDEEGVPSLDLSVNPNGSVLSIEGITSPDGRVLGKMGHTERNGYGVYKNVPGNTFQPLIEGGVSYFTE